MQLIVVITLVAIFVGVALVRSAGRTGLHDGLLDESRCPDPKCRHHNPPTASFCGRCGQRLRG